MTSIRALTTAVLLTACSFLLPLQAFAYQEDPYQTLRQYDYQNRQSVDTISKQIQAAGTNKSKLAVIETGLIAVLQDPQSTQGGKQEACRFLSEIGTGQSVPVLEKLLLTSATSDIARYALERNPDPSAGKALRAALKTTKGTTLVGAINSLGNRSDPQAVPFLKGLSTNSNVLISEAAIAAIGKVGTPAAVTVLRSLPQTNPAVQTALLRSAERLASSNKRSEASALYTSLTKASYPEVIRTGALNGLAAMKSAQIGTLARSIALSASEPTLQRAAARVLGMLNQPAEIQSAVSAWSGFPAPAQVALLSAWADRSETAAAGIIAPALKSSNSEVRTAAIQAARIGGAAVVPRLAELSVSGEYSQAAREALARMGGAGIEPSLLQLAEHGKPEIRTAIIGILAQRPTAASTAVLLRVAEGKESDAASAALKTLGRTAGIDQTSVIVRILTNTADEDIRDAAQSAIVTVAQRTGDRDRTTDTLLLAMEKASVPGQTAVIGALAEIGGDRALDVIAKATESPDETVKSAAISGLANTWADTRALPALLHIGKSGTSKSDRVQALRGYLRLIGSDDRTPSEQRLSQVQEVLAIAERPEEKRQALSVLREIRLPGAVAQATKMLAAPELVTEAADAILYLAAPQKKGNTTLQAVQGTEMNEALDKVIQTVQDENVRTQAQKLRQK